MFLDPTQHNLAYLDEYDRDFQGLGANFFQKLTNKGPLKKIKKVVRKVAAGQAGLVTAGLVNPKVLRIKSKSSKKIYKTTGKIAKIGAAVAATVIAAPVVAPAIGSAGSAVIGGLKFVGGKLVGAGKGVASALADRGETPGTASVAEALRAGAAAGELTPEQLALAQKQASLGLPINAASIFSGTTGLILLTVVGLGAVGYIASRSR